MSKAKFFTSTIESKSLRFGIDVALTKFDTLNLF